MNVVEMNVVKMDVVKRPTRTHSVPFLDAVPKFLKSDY